MKKVKFFTGATLSAVETAINEFVVDNNVELIDVDFRVSRDATTDAVLSLDASVIYRPL